MPEDFDFRAEVNRRVRDTLEALAIEHGMTPDEVMASAAGTLQWVRSTSNARIANNSVRNTYRVLTDFEKAQIDRVKEMGDAFIQLCHLIGRIDPAEERLASRDLSLAVTHIEDAVMRAVRHVTK